MRRRRTRTSGRWPPCARCTSPIPTACSAATRISSPAACSNASIIAMALATDPSLLILDEPTTGLDATVEAEVIDLIGELQERHETAVLFISHNLGRHPQDVPATSACCTRASSSRRDRPRRSCRTRGIRTRSASCAASRAGGCARTSASSTPSAGFLPAIGDAPAGMRLRPPLRARPGCLPDGQAG